MAENKRPKKATTIRLSEELFKLLKAEADRHTKGNLSCLVESKLTPKPLSEITADKITIHLRMRDPSTFLTFFKDVISNNLVAFRGLSGNVQLIKEDLLVDVDVNLKQ